MVKIIVDSTFDTASAVKERLLVAPLTLHFGEEAYIDGVTINHKMFYEKLIESEVLPTTSQATPAVFAEAFAKVAAGDSAVVLTVSSKLSGTYQSAVIAAQDFENIYVVDSDSVTIGAGVLAELALRLADSGMEARKIVETLEAEKKKIQIIAMVDTLEYLKKGGRISKAVAFAGSILNMKPVLSVVEGEIQVLGKARGSKQGNNLLVTEIEKVGGVDFEKPVLLGYTGLTDTLLQKYMEDSRALWASSKTELNTTAIGSVIGTHVGPGAIAAAFFKKENV
jgi:DegV family protein with EDD domain